jgi:hypothetical protein
MNVHFVFTAASKTVGVRSTVGHEGPHEVDRLALRTAQRYLQLGRHVINLTSAAPVPFASR